MKNISRAAMLIMMIGLAQIGYAQATYQVQQNQDVDIKLKGTSSMHDWEMESSKTSGEAQFVFKAGSERELISLTSLTFTLNVKDLKSDSDGLNGNAYEALKSDEYKDICYKLSSATISPEKGGYLIKAKGQLTITDVTKDILMDVHVVANDNGTLKCSGSYNLKMTDYKVKPPSFMFGAMKTGDALTLDFAIVYNQ